MRNKEIYETVTTPSKDEAKGILKTLCDRGIVVANFNDAESRKKLIELGLTMPKEKERWLLFDNDREEALYTFFRLPNPQQSHARPALTSVRFDIARYRSNPLAPDLGVGQACALFERSLAAVARLDLSKCTLGSQSHSNN